MTDSIPDLVARLRALEARATPPPWRQNPGTSATGRLTPASSQSSSAAGQRRPPVSEKSREELIERVAYLEDELHALRQHLAKRHMCHHAFKILSEESTHATRE